MNQEITDYIYDVLSKNLPRNTLADFSIPVSTGKPTGRLLPFGRPEHTPDELKHYWATQLGRKNALGMWIDLVNEVYIGRHPIKSWIAEYIGPHLDRPWPMEDTDNREKVAMQVLAMLSISNNVPVTGMYPQVNFMGAKHGFESKNLMHGWHADYFATDLDNSALLDWRRYIYGYPKIKVGSLPMDLRRLYLISKDLGLETGLHEGYAELVRYLATIQADPRIVHYLVMTHLNPDYEWIRANQRNTLMKEEFKPSRVAKIRLAELAAMRWWKFKNPLPLIVAALRDDFPDVRRLQNVIQHFEFFNFPVNYDVPKHIKDYWFNLITAENKEYGAIRYRKRNRVGRPAKGRRGHFIK